MPGSNYSFDIEVGGGKIHCKNKQEFFKITKQLYEDGHTLMSAYVYNENGFQRITRYVRGTENWIKLK